MRREFQVGDRCRIRQWDDMAEEFGLDEDGRINCYAFFIEGMRYLCGAPFTVSKKFNNPGALYNSEEGYEGYWNISGDMLEYDEPEEPPGQPDFLALLG